MSRLITFCLVLLRIVKFETFSFQTEVAYLLGVAGTDIPIEDIEKVMKPQVVRFLKSFIIFNFC